MEATTRDPRDPVARNNLGTVQLQEGDLDGAEVAFRAAARAAPWLASARANLGVVARRRGDLPAALAELRAALALDPYDENARFNLEKVMKQAGKSDRNPTGPR